MLYDNFDVLVARLIRFDFALSIVEDVYSEYCCDKRFTRDQLMTFCDFLIDMRNFRQLLQSEINFSSGDLKE